VKHGLEQEPEDALERSSRILESYNARKLKRQLDEEEVLELEIQALKLLIKRLEE